MARGAPRAEEEAPARGTAPAGKKKEKKAGEHRGGKGRKLTNCIRFVCRFMQFASGVVTIGVISATKEKGTHFYDWQAFSYLLAGGCFLAFWGLVTLFFDWFDTLAWRLIIFLGDWIVAFIAFSAGCAAAAITTFNDKGAPPYQAALCRDTGGAYNKICSYSKAATSFAFIGFGFLIPTMFMSAFSFFSKYYEG
ncbi:hypothetical protein KFL_001000190 [Klebsormidium nitens]|uniref:CASP-like protein n=1 Tax=Klebsormidium nitens TaxID=105231 RepID=A0A1Y1HZZ0_KLENI|nr:hypothetical protein KFL_001000190 [Klebsormidium nitens]|eukprot:GAQ82097.1 hypothetical protein KFL_001000190 [Klebsormidium nitens]